MERNLLGFGVKYLFDGDKWPFGHRAVCEMSVLYEVKQDPQNFSVFITRADFDILRCNCHAITAERGKGGIWDTH